MDSSEKNKPNKDEKNIIFPGLGRFFQPLPESVKKNLIDKNTFLDINPKKGSSNKEKTTKSEPKGVLVELPGGMTPKTKYSMWSPQNSNLYYKPGQENKPFTFDSSQLPKFLQPKSNSNSKLKEFRARPSTIVKESKTKRTLRFSTRNTISPANTLNRHSLKPPSVSKKTIPQIKITTAKYQDDTSILNDLEELKNIKNNMIILSNNIQKKIVLNKENRLSDIQVMQNTKNDSLKSFELEEQLLCKTPKKSDLGNVLINENLKNFNKKLSELVDNFERSIFDYLSEDRLATFPSQTKDKANDKNQQTQKLFSLPQEASFITTSTTKNLHLRNANTTQIPISEAQTPTSKGNTVIDIETDQSIEKFVLSTPHRDTTSLAGQVNKLNDPMIVSKPSFKYNSTILQQYSELKSGIGNILATPRVDGSGMRLNRQHNIKISENVLKQLSSLDL